MGNKIRNSISRNLLILLVVCTLSGCTTGKEEHAVKVTVSPYEKTTYPVVTVNKGNLTPTLILELHMEEYEKIDYSTDLENLQTDKVYVSEGTAVKKGDVLVRFSSEELVEEQKAVKQEIEENTMLVAHLEKLKKIDDSQDYSKDIQSLKRDLEILSLKSREIDQKLENYSIVAKEDGVITYVNEMLYYELSDKPGVLFCEECGSDNYSVTVMDDYPFEKGKEYEAKSGVASYKVRLEEITKTEEGSRQLLFSPVSDMTGLKQTDTVTITIKKPELKNVVYMNKNAVFQKEDRSFVYKLNEAGYREAVDVKTGETVDDMIVITSGLSGGEQVTEY